MTQFDHNRKKESAPADSSLIEAPAKSMNTVQWSKGIGILVPGILFRQCELNAPKPDVVVFPSAYRRVFYSPSEWREYKESLFQAQLGLTVLEDSHLPYSAQLDALRDVSTLIQKFRWKMEEFGDLSEVNDIGLFFKRIKESDEALLIGEADVSRRILNRSTTYLVSRKAAFTWVRNQLESSQWSSEIINHCMGKRDV